MSNLKKLLKPLNGFNKLSTEAVKDNFKIDSHAELFGAARLLSAITFLPQKFKVYCKNTLYVTMAENFL